MSLVFCIRLAAQTPGIPSSATTAEDVETCSVEGSILESSTALRVAKATVVLVRSDGSGVAQARGTNYKTISDHAGKYSFSGIPPGAYRILVFHDRFLPMEYGARVSQRLGSTITVEKGQHLRGLDVGLTPHGVIQGKILDQDGDPLANAQVQLTTIRYVRGKKENTTAGAAQSNDRGEYRIFGIAPGKYYLNAQYRPVGLIEMAVNKPTDHTAKAETNLEYVPTYYPGTSDFQAAALIDITAGAELHNVDLRLKKGSLVRVAGRVRAEPPEDGSNAAVLLTPQDVVWGRFQNRNATADPHGGFIIERVLPGSYFLRAVVQRGGRVISARTPIIVGQNDIGDLQITLRPGATVKARVRLDSANYPPITGLRLSLLADGGSPNLFDPSRECQLDGKDLFRCDGVEEAHYRIALTGLPESFFVKDIVVADTSILYRGLDIKGPSLTDLDVLVGTRGGQVNGIVSDTNQTTAQSRATVVLVPTEQDRQEQPWCYRLATTDQDGKFSMKGLIPGAYRVFCWEDVEYGAWMDADFLRSYPHDAIQVVVREGSIQSLHLALPERNSH